jgi:hypothetical protein
LQAAIAGEAEVPEIEAGIEQQRIGSEAAAE